MNERLTADSVRHARTPTSRGYREPGNEPTAREPGSEIQPGAYVSARRIREVLQGSRHSMGAAELARRLGIDRNALNQLLTATTYSCSELFEDNRGRLGLLGSHDDDASGQ